MSDFDAAVKLLADECRAIQKDEHALGMEAVVRHVLSAAVQDVTLAPLLTAPVHNVGTCRRCGGRHVREDFL